MNEKPQDDITRPLDKIVMRLICPICHTHLLPSLGYGTGYWLCNCALCVGIPTPQDKRDWVKQVESILGRA